MRVLILNQTFHPDVAATAQHMWDLARHLDRAGHQIIVITSQTRYGSSERFEKSYERAGNIHIHRVPQTAFGKVHNAGRMADFLSFYVSAFWQMQKVATPDVILSLTSPPMVCVLGMLLKQFSSRSGQRIALVNHVMDLYPDAAIAMGVLKPGGMITRLMSSLTRRTLGSAEALIALGHDMRDRLVTQYVPQRQERVHVVTPWADQSEIYPTLRDNNPLRAQLGLKDDFVLLYSGNFGQAHDIDTIVGAIRATRDRANLRWCFTGGGRGMVKLRDLAAVERWEHVRFLPYQPREALNDLLNLADVHLISQSPAFTGIVVPSKLFGILAAGKPSIMVGPDNAEASRILVREDAGVVVRPGDVNGMVEAIERLQSDPARRAAMGDNARRALCDRYDCSIACKQIETLLLQAVNNARNKDR